MSIRNGPANTPDMLALLLFADPKSEDASDSSRLPAGSRRWAYAFFGLVFAAVLAAGVAVFGSGKFGWTVVAVVLACVFYRYVFSK